MEIPRTKPLWPQLLTMVATGDREEARQKLFLEVPCRLRSLDLRTGRERAFSEGPVPTALFAFRRQRPAHEQSLLETYHDDLVERIVDDVLNSIERSLDLVDICCLHPGFTLDEIASKCPWAPGLKRSHEWKREWVADMLWSMIDDGVPLPSPIVDLIGDRGEQRYALNEVAYAVGVKRLERTWSDFMDDMELGRNFPSIVEDEEDYGVGNEAADFCSVQVSRLTAHGDGEREIAVSIDYRILGQELTVEITEILETLHARRPSDGFRPIAWHYVFWKLSDKYSSLPLSLECHEPSCETDESLVVLIKAEFPDVTKTSRPSILRRRTKLDNACEDHVYTRCVVFLRSNEQSS